MDPTTMKIAPRLYSAAPEPQTRLQMNPTLLVSWWATGFSLAIILVRVCGRYVRTERLFREDWVMALSIIPLLIRMGFVHVVLIWGTNNVISDGLTRQQIHQREIGSRMVLGARIFYALFIWTAKFTITEFLMRITVQIWRRSFKYVLQFIRFFLAITYVAVVIATLTECQPFNHYWQVVPEPAAKCRQGYAQLITMGSCDVITDLLLVAFPVPIIQLSAMPAKRKVSLTLLFALSLVLVAITCYRVPSVISRDGNQQYRSLLASLEILAAAAVSNAIVIGSFVRDRGLKKQKFKIGSFTESVEQTSSRRATVTHHHWGSDADLVGDMGINLDPELRTPNYENIRPAPIAYPTAQAKRGSIDRNWGFPPAHSHADDDRTSTTDSLGGLKVHPHEYIETDEQPATQTRPAPAPARRDSYLSKISLNDVGGLLTPPSRNPNSSRSRSRRPSPPGRHPSRGRSIFSAVSGLLSPSSGLSSSSPQPPQQQVRNFSRPRGDPFMASGARLPGSRDPSPRSASPGPSHMNGQNRTGSSQRKVPELQDLGGLLKDDVKKNPPPS